MQPADGSEARILPADRLDALLGVLRQRGYRVVGPVVRAAAVRYEEVRSAADLARGWTDRQQAGSYRLERDSRDLYFGLTVGAESWKRLLFPPRLRLWAAEQNESGFRVEAPAREEEAYAFLGVRPCDLAAIAIQDRVLLGGPYQDPEYRARRSRSLLIAVNCSQAAATCFCTSMGTGPRATRGFDLALTELRDASGHRFLVEAGSERGRAVLDSLPSHLVTERDREAAERVSAETAAAVRRRMPAGIEQALRNGYEHPRWQEIADRCLACTNCTLVCPTCFCVAVEDTTDLSGRRAERSRRWDSCFTGQHSYIHGGSVHGTIASRYRQWLTHKLSTWVDQFGSSGCVGCGRCIAWCPAAIDITEEAAAIAETKPC